MESIKQKFTEEQTLQPKVTLIFNELIKKPERN